MCRGYRYPIAKPGIIQVFRREPDKIGAELGRLALPSRRALKLGPMAVLSFLTMKVLLTGASGLLGRAISSKLSARADVELSAVGFSRAKPPMIRADITDPAAVDALFAATKLDFVIHAAAERRPEIVDKNPSLARTLNVAATETIASACAKRGAFMLYISTDYVFDGSNPPYYPDSPTHPLNEYGSLKLEGEGRVASILADGERASFAAPRAAILRIPLLYGPVETLGECSVTELASLLKKREPCAVEHWARRYPLHVDDVAAAIAAILDAAAVRPERLSATRSRTGSSSRAGLPIFLLSGPVAYTKYEMVMAMAKVFGVDASFARPDASPPKGAPRPKDCRMDTSLIETLGYKPQVEFEVGIGGALAPFFRG